MDIYNCSPEHTTRKLKEQERVKKDNVVSAGVLCRPQRVAALPLGETDAECGSSSSSAVCWEHGCKGVKEKGGRDRQTDRQTG